MTHRLNGTDILTELYQATEVCYRNRNVRMQVKCIIGQHAYNALAKHWRFCTCIEYVSGLNVIHRGGYCYLK